MNLIARLRNIYSNGFKYFWSMHFCINQRNLPKHSLAWLIFLFLIAFFNSNNLSSLESIGTFITGGIAPLGLLWFIAEFKTGMQEFTALKEINEKQLTGNMQANSPQIIFENFTHEIYDDELELTIKLKNAGGLASIFGFQLYQLPKKEITVNFTAQVLYESGHSVATINIANYFTRTQRAFGFEEVKLSFSYFDMFDTLFSMVISLGTDATDPKDPSKNIIEIVERPLPR